MSVVADIRQRSSQARIIIGLLLIAFILIGGALGKWLETADISIAYWEARLAYGALAVLAGALILQQVHQYSWRGLLTPLSMTMFGFGYFFFMFPIVNPGILSTLYSDPGRFMPVVGLIAVGMLSFVAGYVLSPSPGWTPLDGLIKRSINHTRLVYAGLVLGVVFAALWLIISALGDFSPLSLILQSRYALSDQFGVAEMQGLNHYLWQFLFYLPVALAPILTLIIVEVRLPLWARFIFIAILAMCVLLAFGSGVRFMLAYAIGGVACTLVLRTKGILRLNRMRLLMAALAVAATVVLTSLQLQTRSYTGLYDLVTGSTELSITNSVTGFTNDVTGDQNYTLESVIRAMNAGTIRPLWGETYELTFVLLIPRAIWASKPGLHLVQALAPANPFYGDNVSYSVIGELAFNFTLWGVPIGMFIGGLLAGAWWKWYRRHQTQAQAAMLYSMSVASFAFMVRGSFNTMFSAVMYPMLLVFLAIAFSSASRTLADTVSVHASRP